MKKTSKLMKEYYKNEILPLIKAVNRRPVSAAVIAADIFAGYPTPAHTGQVYNRLYRMVVAAIQQLHPLYRYSDIDTRINRPLAVRLAAYKARRHSDTPADAYARSKRVVRRAV